MPAREPGELTRLLAPFLAEPRLARMRDVLTRRTHYLTAVLDRLYDPNNVAACMRTADALGLQDLHVVTSPRTSPRGLRVGRTVSLDADRWLTTTRHDDPSAAIAGLRDGGHRVVVAALADHATTLDALPLDKPLAVVFGAERDGLADAFVAAADHVVSLPMRGFAQSLSVSAAFAIIMSRLRDRLDVEVAPDVVGLDAARTTRLLDDWILGDVDHAERILDEIARRDPSLCAQDPQDHGGNGGAGRAKR